MNPVILFSKHQSVLMYMSLGKGFVFKPIELVMLLTMDLELKKTPGTAGLVV